MLGLGIGLAVGLFTVAYDALLRPLPYRDEARVVMLYEFAPAKDILKGSATPGNFLDWRSRSRAFSHVGALTSFSATLATEGEPVRVNGRRVTADLFGALGVDPLLGRLFSVDDERSGHDVATLTSGRRSFRRTPPACTRSSSSGLHRRATRTSTPSPASSRSCTSCAGCADRRPP